MVISIQKWEIFNFRYFITVIMMFGFGLAVMKNASMIPLTIALILLSYLILTGNSMEDFYTYVALIPFSGLVTVAHIGVLFIFLLISIFKLIIKNLETHLSITGLIWFLVIFCIELCGDMFSVKVGLFINFISYFSYFFLFILIGKLEQYNHKKSIVYLVSSILAAFISTIIASGGSISSFITQDSSGTVNRFGEDARTLGGAMGIPIYSLLLITLLISYMLTYKTKAVEKIFIFSVLIFSLLIGFLSVSRVYLLGLAAICMCLLLSLATKRKTKIIKLCEMLLLLAVVVMYFKPDIIQNIIQNFVSRNHDIAISSDISTGRFKIYNSCFSFFSSHPIALLFGSGAINYEAVGKSGGYLFGEMQAHNLYLDGILSWGIVGFLALVILVGKFAGKCSCEFHTSANIIGLMPAIVLGACYMTAGTFSSFKIYIYILLLTINTFCFGTHKQKEESGQVQKSRYLLRGTSGCILDCIFTPAAKTMAVKQ